MTLGEDGRTAVLNVILECRPAGSRSQLHSRPPPTTPNIAAVTVSARRVQAFPFVRAPPRPASRGVFFGRHSKAARALHRAALETNCRAGPRFRSSAG